MGPKIWILAGVAVASALAVALLLRDRGRDAPETSSEPVRVEIGGRPLEIPRNAVRFADQRRPGPHARLDLALSWPELDGRSAATSARFDSPDYAPDILYVTIAPRRDGTDSASRLATVYARFFVGEPQDGPGGLQGRRLAPKSGYDDEEVWLEPGVVRPFVARCFPLTPGEAPVMCLHDVNRGSLTVSLRFPSALLGDWRTMVAGLDARLAAWGVETP